MHVLDWSGLIEKMNPKLPAKPAALPKQSCAGSALRYRAYRALSESAHGMRTSEGL
jgi:hypothetical protein